MARGPAGGTGSRAVAVVPVAAGRPRLDRHPTGPGYRECMAGDDTAGGGKRGARWRETGCGRGYNTPDSGVIARERRCLELRLCGRSFDVIADEVGYANRSAALKAVRRALARTLQEPADELRQVELARLDALHEVVWTMALAGDLHAVDRVLRIAERRARLMGLDAPTRVRVSEGAADREVELAAAEIARTVDDVIARAMDEALLGQPGPAERRASA